MVGMGVGDAACGLLGNSTRIEEELGVAACDLDAVA
jgi:hypothetical protein